jgi:hypothetical protein
MRLRIWRHLSEGSTLAGRPRGTACGPSIAATRGDAALAT